MKRASTLLAIAMCALLFARADANAQGWTKILQLDSNMGASAFFFNASDG